MVPIHSESPLCLGLFLARLQDKIVWFEVLHSSIFQDFGRWPISNLFQSFSCLNKHLQYNSVKILLLIQQDSLIRCIEHVLTTWNYQSTYVRLEICTFSNSNRSNRHQNNINLFYLFTYFYQSLYVLRLQP